MGREGPQGCVLVHMCVSRKKVGGVDIQEALDGSWSARVLSSAC